MESNVFFAYKFHSNEALNTIEFCGHQKWYVHVCMYLINKLGIVSKGEIKTTEKCNMQLFPRITTIQIRYL